MRLRLWFSLLLLLLEPSELRARAERGRAHWDALGCAGCHLPEGAAPGMITVPLRELGRRHDLEELTAFLAAPTPPMPAVALDQAAREDLAIHLLERFR